MTVTNKNNMKSILLFCGLVTTTICFAQPKVITSATITTITNVIAPEEEEVSQVGQGGGGGGFNFRTMMDGESKSVTMIKNDMVKTSLKSETFKSTIYKNNTTKTTYTVSEVMGNKIGIIATEGDQEEMKKKADSMMAERAKTDTTMKRRTRNVDFASTVSYIEETKKIAGYLCKKAIIITDKILSKDSMIVWYCPEFKFANVASTGGMSGIPMGRGFGGGSGADNFDKVNGFVMMYEREMPRGRKMEVKVSKVELNTTTDDKEFEAPKDIEYKTMKEMMNGQGGNIRMIQR